MSEGMCAPRTVWKRPSAAGGVHSALGFPLELGPPTHHSSSRCWRSFNDVARSCRNVVAYNMRTSWGYKHDIGALK